MLTVFGADWQGENLGAALMMFVGELGVGPTMGNGSVQLEAQELNLDRTAAKPRDAQRQRPSV